ncbi:phosphotransferase family protein [Amycolatopsis thermophila]|uniref:Aminoglycoside phosphotransferase (APT) family kinase protein n=1 Tax=Amycolatopsis thermophila TaxID=206084 RepID=A0ABU0F573_9PSEU|nr:phosphotransferase family protein [Amycolatopsis thermophila]MDQ0382739.1 aminoglycoside phosphotransferase (APT) family kinase protein [Amycolatopsis thermophila]
MGSASRPAGHGAGVGAADPADIVRRAGEAMGAEVTGLAELKGGRSGLTYSARAGGEPVVVKVAPPGLAPVRDRDVLRQARVLSVLAGVPGVEVPAVLGAHPGAPPEVPPLLVMSSVDGERYEPRHTDSPVRPPAGVVLTRMRLAAGMLAALHTADPFQAGLDEPVSGPEDELGRWRTAFASCELEPRVAELEAECGRLLEDALPAPVWPSILHGDWRMGNMQCAGTEIRAVTDWEIWSVGDPRADLAWMRLMSDPAHPAVVAPWAPAVEPAELRAVYEAAMGREVADLAWFDALARYKQAAASALLVKNAQRRGEAPALTEKSRRVLPLLLAAAHERLTGAA